MGSPDKGGLTVLSIVTPVTHMYIPNSSEHSFGMRLTKISTLLVHLLAVKSFTLEAAACMQPWRRLYMGTLSGRVDGLGSAAFSSSTAGETNMVLNTSGDTVQLASIYKYGTAYNQNLLQCLILGQYRRVSNFLYYIRKLIFYTTAWTNRLAAAGGR